MTKKDLMNIYTMRPDSLGMKKISIEPYNRQLTGSFIVKCLRYLLLLGEDCVVCIDGSGFNIDGLYEFKISEIDKSIFVWDNYNGKKHKIIPAGGL